MIFHYDRISAQAADKFWQWASLFSSEVFVKLVAYADESHSGKRDSEVLIIAGWIALRDEWSQFCVEWRKVLNEYAAPYFHFREWADASAVVRGKRRASSEFTKKNPYRNWDQSKLDGFLLELAEVAASGNRLIIGGYVPEKKLEEDKASGFVETKSSAEDLCIKHFFDSAASTINRQRSPLKRQPIAFFFDHSDNPEWKKIVNDGFDFSRHQNRHFKEIAFAPKEDHLPLQAADMVAYRLRQTLENTINLDFSKTWPKFDNIIFRSINAGSEKLDDKERDVILRRVFMVPKHATYEQAMNSIKTRSISKHANKAKK